MALIKCPECGREVSNVATACPTCGFPIAANNPSGDVKIKINMNPMYLASITIIDAETDRELWRGKNGNVAIIHVDKPTDIKIIASSPKKPLTATMKAGEKYEVTQEAGFWAPRDVLRIVDVIDSGT